MATTRSAQWKATARQTAQAFNVNVAGEQHCESRRNRAQESTAFCTPWGAIDLSSKQNSVA
jgi:hypothetical protein